MATDGVIETLDTLTEQQMFPSDVGQLLRAAVLGKANIVVSGAVNCGKTTLLRALTHEVPSDERLITVEYTLELGIAELEDDHPNTVELEVKCGVSMSTLLKETRYMNPDRVIVGDIRGEEMFFMIRIMTQGNNGSMCCIQTDSVEQSINQMMAYSQQTSEARVTEQVAADSILEAVDLIVHLSNNDGSRFMSELCEVMEGTDDKPRLVNLFTNPECIDHVPDYQYERMSEKLQRQIVPHLPADHLALRN